MRTYSKKRQQQERNLRKIERELKADPANDKCFFYPFERRSEFHHIIPKSQNALLIDCKENLIPIGITAHNILHRGTTYQIKRLRNLDKYLEKMKSLDEGYYNRFAMRLEDTITYKDLEEIDNAREQ